MEKLFIKKRSRMEILIDILSLCTKRRKKTHILYGANMSYNQLSSYLKFLTTRELLTRTTNDTETYYKLTLKGFTFLENLKSIESVLKGT